MKTKVLAIALATLAATVAADAAAARDLVRVSSDGQITVQRGRKTTRISSPRVVVSDDVMIVTPYSWSIPRHSVVSGYGYTLEW